MSVNWRPSETSIKTPILADLQDIVQTPSSRASRPVHIGRAAQCLCHKGFCVLARLDSWSIQSVSGHLTQHTMHMRLLITWTKL